MAKVLKCGDVMPGCTAVLEGVDDTDVIRKVTEHAKSVHKMATVPPDVVNKVRAAIKTKL
jgi:predicted small metal-binding protein